MSDFLKRMQQITADEKKSSTSAPAVSSSKPSVSTATVSTASATSNKPAVKSDWLKDVQPLADQLKTGLNYEKHGYIMRAYSGRYDGIANDPNTDAELKKTLKALKHGAVTLAAGLKTKNDKLYQQGASETFNNWQKVQELTVNENSAYKVESDNFKLSTKNQAAKNNEHPVFYTDKQGNVESTVKITGEDNINKEISWSYFSQKGMNNRWQSSIKNQIKPVLTNWYDQSTKSLYGKSVNADDKYNAYNLSKDLLQHVAEHGDENKENKKEANAIIKQMWKEKTIEGKIEVIKNNRAAIKELSGKLGYYGSTSIYNRHVDKLKRQELYHSDDLDNIKESINGYSEFQNFDKKVKADVATRLKNSNPNGDPAFNYLFNEDNNLRSYSEFKKLYYNKIPLDKLTDAGYNVQYASQQTYDAAYNEASAKTYSELTKQYRLGYNNVDIKNFSNDTFYVNGIGNEVVKIGGYESIDFTLRGDNKTIKNIGKSNKQNYAQNVLNKIFDVDGNLEKDVVIKKDVDGNFERYFDYESSTKDKVGSSGKPTAKNLKEAFNEGSRAAYSEPQDMDVFKSYFKNPRPDVDILFIKHTGNQNYSSYVIKDRKTKETLQMYVPKSRLKDDYFFKNTDIDKFEHNFRITGEKVLPEIKDKRPDGSDIFMGQPSISINNKKGTKELHFTLVNDEGKPVDKVVTIGSNESVNIKEANTYAKKLLAEIVNSYNVNL